MIEAFAQVVARRPRALLVFVGDGDEREAIERTRARARASPSASRFAGFVDDRALVATYVAASRVCLSPGSAKLAIGRPMKLAEYLAAGRAVVGSAIPGIAEMLAETGGGIAVAPHDPAAMADALCDLLADPAAADALGPRPAVDRRALLVAGDREPRRGHLPVAARLAGRDEQQARRPASPSGARDQHEARDRRTACRRRSTRSRRRRLRTAGSARGRARRVATRRGAGEQRGRARALLAREHERADVAVGQHPDARQQDEEGHERRRGTPSPKPTRISAGAGERDREHAEQRRACPPAAARAQRGDPRPRRPSA